MDRDEFMELIYETFAEEPDNVLANGIIEAADAYVEHEKAQLSSEDATSDLISRQAALEKVRTMQTYKLFMGDDMILVDRAEVQTELMMLQGAQPEVLACGSGELVAQPELTDEQAITHLQSSGWMQRHDKETYESGLKEYLADDSDSYDSLLPSAQPEPQWIPVSERLPEDLVEVNVTWVNRNPESYYEPIKDKPFTTTAVYYKGEWYWLSATCVDYLAEYGRCDWNKVDKAIEIVAWMPLPEPYKPNK